MSSKRLRRSAEKGAGGESGGPADETAQIAEAVAAVERIYAVVVALKTAGRPTKRNVDVIAARKVATRAVGALSPGGKLEALNETKGRIPTLSPDMRPHWRPIVRALTSTARRHEGPKWFPAYLRTYGPAGFSYEPFRQGDGEAALTRLYKPRLDRESYRKGETPKAPPVEIFYGEVYQKYDVTVDEAAIVPVSALARTATLKVGRAGEPTETLKIGPDGFAFVPVPKGATTLRSASPIAFGRPMVLKAGSGGKPPLVMSIFLDGLSGSVFDTTPLEALMPNTARFFEGQARSTSAHAVAEWTLPNIASVMTGLRPHQHRILQPLAAADIVQKGRPYWPAAIRDAGYNTVQFCSNWRKSPGYGYSQSFDRTLYHRGGMAAENVIGEAIEHLEVFKDRPNYAWLTFFDLHHDLGSGPSILSAAAGQVEDVRPGLKSVRMELGEGLVEKYVLKIRRLDLMLGALYDFIERRYPDEDVRIGLFSDHGVSFLSHDRIKDFLRVSETRCRVPMMFRGQPFRGLALPKYAQNLDHFRTLFTGVAPVIDRMAPFAAQSADVDLTTTGRDHAVTESIYPRQHYLFRYTDDAGSSLYAGPKMYERNAEDEAVGNRTFRRRNDEWTPGEMPPAARELIRLREAELLKL